jgi:hypothetical protein
MDGGMSSSLREKYVSNPRGEDLYAQVRFRRLSVPGSSALERIPGGPGIR